jgi:hypothetical protein
VTDCRRAGLRASVASLLVLICLFEYSSKSNGAFCRHERVPRGSSGWANIDACPVRRKWFFGEGALIDVDYWSQIAT